MTREEAISNLRNMMDGMPFDKCSDWIDACNVAIRSLEAWEKVEEDLNGDFSEQSKGFRYGIDYALLAIADCFAGVEGQSD